MIIIPGFTSASKTPGAVGQQVFGAGPYSTGQIPLICLCVGTATSDGSATPDVSVQACFSKDDVSAFAGFRSELANMGYAALNIPGVTLVLAANAEAGGAASATLTLTIGGTWTVGGTISVDLDGNIYQVTVGTTTAVDATATAIASAVSADAYLFCTASPASAVVTFTVASKGVRGNQHACHVDLSAAPPGRTAVLASGTPYADGGVPFSGGSGTDSLTNILAVLFPGTYDRIAYAQKTPRTSGSRRPRRTRRPARSRDVSRIPYSHRTARSRRPRSLASTTLNQQLCQWLWMLNGRTVPSRVAATMAALRSVTEGDNPNPNYAGTVLPGIAPHFRIADQPNRSTTDGALNTGVTPLNTVNGQVQIVRAITTHCLTGSNPDYRTLDVGQAVVPQRVRQDLVAFWNFTYSQANPYVRPDPPASAPVPLQGVATPRLWNAEVEAYLRTKDGSTPSAANWIFDVDDNLPQSVWDPVAKRIMTVVPTNVTPLNLQQGIVVRQVG